MSNDLKLGLGLGAAIAGCAIVFLDPAAWAAGAINWLAAVSGIVVAGAAVAAIWEGRFREASAAMRNGRNLYTVAFNEVNAIANRSARLAMAMDVAFKRSGADYVPKDMLLGAVVSAVPRRESLLPSVAGQLGNMGSSGPNFVLLTVRTGVENAEYKLREVCGSGGYLMLQDAKSITNSCARSVVWATLAQIAMAYELRLGALTASTSSQIEIVNRLLGRDVELSSADMCLDLMEHYGMQDTNEEWVRLIRSGEVKFF